MENQEKLYSAYRKWRRGDARQHEGIIVASDMTQEWLLPWWWSHYSRHNSHPVSFVDFGMSFEMKKWCKERGELLPLHVADIFVSERQEISSSLVREWESDNGKQFWSNRNAWFKKPLACLLSPYQKSIWIDLDCEIKGSIKTLFSLCENTAGIAIAREVVGFNSGVIVFKRRIALIETWASKSLDENHTFFGDQDILSKIIEEENIEVTELSPIYNWSRFYESNLNAVILHWHGPHGKSVITHQIMQANLESLELLNKKN